MSKYEAYERIKKQIAREAKITAGIPEKSQSTREKTENLGGRNGLQHI